MASSNNSNMDTGQSDLSAMETSQVIQEYKKSSGQMIKYYGTSSESVPRYEANHRPRMKKSSSARADIYARAAAMARYNAM